MFGKVLKKGIAMMLTFLFVLSLAACGASETSGTPSGGNGTDADQTAADADNTQGTAEGEDDQQTQGVTFDGEITFGVICSITGNFPLAGENTKKGVDMAVKEINEAGGVLGKKFVVTYQDDAANQTGAVNALNKLISEEVVGVIGPNMSSNIISMADTAAAAGIPCLVGGTSPKIAALNNPYIFRIRPSDNITAAAAAKFMYETLGKKKIGILYNTDDFGTGARDVMLEYFKDKSDATLTVEGLNTGDTDLSGQITKMKSSGIESLIYWGHDAEVAILARQVNELGLDVPVLTSGSLPQVISAIDGSYIDGWYVALDECMNDPSEVIQNFVTAFKEEYDGATPELYAAAFYGATRLLADAIERAGSTDYEAITAALRETNGVQGIIGQYACQENQDMLNVCAIMQYDKDKNETLAANITID